jgi:hypothetical protein
VSRAGSPGSLRAEGRQLPQVPPARQHTQLPLRRPSKRRFSSSRLLKPLRPRRGAASTSQGRPHSIKRAIQRRNVVAALAAARELPQLSLEDALELTLLVARKDPRRHPRVAGHWLLRYLEEDPAATIEEAALAASCLVALTGAGYQEAVQTLRAMAERATRRRREQGVA